MDFRFEPDEFVVEEIAQDGTVFEIDKKIESLSCIPLEGEHKFCWFVLQKFNWNTQQALEEIARKAGVSRKRFNFAGTKDRKAITTQLCSAFGVAPQRLESVHVKDLNAELLAPGGQAGRLVLWTKDALDALKNQALFA